MGATEVAIATLLFMWPLGFVALEILAAREGSRAWWETLSRLAWLEWAQGRSRKARVLATAAWVWLVGGFLFLAAVMFIYSLSRRR